MVGRTRAGCAVMFRQSSLSFASSAAETPTLQGCSGSYSLARLPTHSAARTTRLRKPVASWMGGDHRDHRFALQVARAHSEADREGSDSDRRSRARRRCAGASSCFQRQPLSVKERVFEYVHAVVVQINVLLSRKFANAHAGVDAPGIQKLVSDLRHNHKFLAAGESDVALIE